MDKMSGNSDETIPQIAQFIQESSVRPPPPPSHPPSTSFPRTPARALRPMQPLPPPPPPPPAVPSAFNIPTYQFSYTHSPQPTSTTTSNAINYAQPPVPFFDASRPPPPSIHHAQIRNNLKRSLPTSSSAHFPQPTSTTNSNAINYAQPPVPFFDASRPPPPPIHHAQIRNNLKRSLPTSSSAPASKLRKTENPMNEDAKCDVCLQREISLEICKLKQQKIRSEDEYQTLLFKKTLYEYRKHKQFLRSLLDNNMYRMVEDFIESSSVHVEDTLRQTLSFRSRSPIGQSDIWQTLQDILHRKERSGLSESIGYGGLNIERAFSHYLPPRAFYLSNQNLSNQNLSNQNLSNQNLPNQNLPEPRPSTSRAPESPYSFDAADGYLPHQYYPYQ